jgi:hypothetical protein
MPTPTYTPLATVTLATTAASVTFSSIPATYRDLILVSRPTTSNDVTTRLRMNNDSSSSYSLIYMYGYSSGTLSGTVSGNYLDIAGSGTQGATSIAQIMDYSATDKHKTILARQVRGQNSVVAATAHRWANTSAITSITIAGQPFSSWNTGTYFSLYGIGA